MDTLSIVLVAFGGIVGAIGGIMLLVAAFRQSIGWGLASLFIPLASLVFIIVHWAEAKRGFLVNLFGGFVAVAGLVASPTVRAIFTNGLPKDLNAAFEKVENSPDLLADEIQQKRDQIELAEIQFRTDAATLSQEFQALQAKRAALKDGDTTAIAAFNAEAAAYQGRTAILREWRKKIDADQMTLTELLDKRARLESAAKAPANSNKSVVIYTTSSCPACKAAKDYMARRGVRYEEKNVDTSSEARAEFDRLGGRGVPLIMVGTERMEGFSSQRLDKLL